MYCRIYKGFMVGFGVANIVFSVWELHGHGYSNRSPTPLASASLLYGGGVFAEAYVVDATIRLGQILYGPGFGEALQRRNDFGRLLLPVSIILPFVTGGLYLIGTFSTPPHPMLVSVGFVVNFANHMYALIDEGMEEGRRMREQIRQGYLELRRWRGYPTKK
jgi:hypothetical protein